MKRIITILCCCLALFFAGCTKPAKKETNWEVQYSTVSKDPYGFYLMAQVMPKLYPSANFKEIPVNANIFSTSSNSNKSVYVGLASSINLSAYEMRQLDDWIYEGNEAVLIANAFDPAFLKALSLSLKASKNRTIDNEKKIIDQVQVKVSKGNILKSYTVERYEHLIFSNYFDLTSAKDTASGYTILSTDTAGHPIAIAFRIGSGRMILVSSPLSFSNYFLLEPNNNTYIEDILAYTSKDVKNVYLALGYYKAPQNTSLGILWDHMATRMALILSVLGILIYVLFNLRRKQNIIPVIEPLKNDSASFVETIAGLYFNKHNNKNLAQKMIQHFFEYVRSTYQLNTNVLDEVFEQKLSIRAGRSQAEANYLLIQIRQVQQDTIDINDAFLHSLYKNIQAFYKK